MALVVRGLRETLRALNQVEEQLGKDLQDEFKKAAEPVAETGREKISRYQGASVRTIAARASVRGAFVTQRKRTVTGLRGDFGALQMRRLGEALDENEDEVVEAVEEALDRFSASAGF